MIETPDKPFGLAVYIQDGAVCIGGVGQEVEPRKCLFLIRLEDVDFVIDDALPLEWEPASDSMFKVSGESPLLRLFGTYGTFRNPKTDNPAFLIYKHRDKCVTITLKQPQVVIPSALTGSRKWLVENQTPAVKEISFEVEDKEAAKDLIVQALLAQRSQGSQQQPSG